MRKIERQMNEAIRNGSNFSSSNTMVKHSDKDKEVFIHCNHIATVTDNALTLFDGGWQSNTTKSRLNALINEFCDGTKTGVFQKNWTWFVKAFGITTVFHDGISIPLL